MHEMTLEGFRNWLGTLPPATKFDMHSGSACVVVSYYQSVYPHARVRMAGYAYAVDIDGVGWFNVPRWAVDLQYAYYPPTTRHRFATPDQVLQTLDELTSVH